MVCVSLGDALGTPFLTLSLFVRKEVLGHDLVHGLSRISNPDHCF